MTQLKDYCAGNLLSEPAILFCNGLKPQLKRATNKECSKLHLEQDENVNKTFENKEHYGGTN